MIHILEKHLGMMWVGVGADDRFCNIVFSDPGMLLIYLITGTYYSEGKM